MKKSLAVLAIALMSACSSGDGGPTAPITEKPVEPAASAIAPRLSLGSDSLVISSVAAPRDSIVISGTNAAPVVIVHRGSAPWPSYVLISTSPSGGCKMGAGVRFNQSGSGYNAPTADSIRVQMSLVACPDSAKVYHSATVPLTISFNNGVTTATATITAVLK